MNYPVLKIKITGSEQSLTMEKFQIHISDISHVIPLSKHCGVQFTCGTVLQCGASAWAILPSHCRTLFNIPPAPACC
jgi:hypothetical protein